MKTKSPGKKNRLNYLNHKKISNFIFEVAIFFLPLENFFFAPSSGWATITPIILSLYILFNIKKTFAIFYKYWKIVITTFSTLLIITIIDYVLWPINLYNFIQTIIPIGLGIVCLLSIIIYYEENHSLSKITKILIISYTISLVFGLIEFITIKFDIHFMREFFKVFFKRSYVTNNRIQFFFTEPSFIGMHLYGVVLPIYLIEKNPKIAYVGLAILFASLFSSASVRLFLDTFIVFAIFFFSYIIKTHRMKLLVVLLATMIIGFIGIYNISGRVRKIVSNGIYADGSFASRFFRIESSVYGYINDFPKSLLGYGMGNSLLPIRSGHSQAAEHYKSSYMHEVEELADPGYNNDSASYCLYTRIASEFGIISLVAFLIFLFYITKQSNFSYRWELLLTTLYLYVQFESYAFYTLWIFMAIMLFTYKEKTKKQTTHKGEKRASI